MTTHDNERVDRNPLGPTGLRVARNLRELRGPIPVRELSSRLTKLGRPIAPSGITKMEQGTRRIDTDDLVALALALDVTPNRLLLTEDADLWIVESRRGGPGDSDAEATPVGLVPELYASTAAAWLWAAGDLPLTDLELASESTASLSRERRANFATINRPDHPDRITGTGEMTTTPATMTGSGTLSAGKTLDLGRAGEADVARRLERVEEAVSGIAFVVDGERTDRITLSDGVTVEISKGYVETKYAPDPDDGSTVSVRQPLEDGTTVFVRQQVEADTDAER